ncbi:Hypothetical protein PP7435_CHR4-0462 [Komagataella phaffii CBS 7435]|uniref:Uncharacterized protein n=1 Tax=Komagataella phaffii (strain ATCC 76273 / CBS 7435 / CECT 11047 / NRRL Y-11430 / Wegner 21-1) TaxID=981350 RepID=F2QZ00_KOMPC|nr:Hypothetical protein BQ9382_C4-2408 [Komagataella phaffii CBS 7435]CCA40628.1 Hypothetical protein PP7435_CHR4-0462 [Komagataella phaffii CBS 7435]
MDMAVEICEKKEMAIIKLIDDSTKVHQSGRAPRPDEINLGQSSQTRLRSFWFFCRLAAALKILLLVDIDPLRLWAALKKC